jgi:hypothetical protein
MHTEQITAVETPKEQLGVKPAQRVNERVNSLRTLNDPVQTLGVVLEAKMTA